MLKIRLKRIGRKKINFYRIVLKKNLSNRDGLFITELGYYSPQQKCFVINKELIKKLLIKGAYPSNPIRSLIKKICINFESI